MFRRDDAFASYEHVLRRTPDGLRMVRKTARLVDNDRPIPTLAFLI